MSFPQIEQIKRDFYAKIIKKQGTFLIFPPREGSNYTTA